MDGLEEIQRELRQFVSERDWEQFHTPKNLATALLCEAAELAEIFQWLTPEESLRAMDDPERAEAVRDELADVFSYLLRMVDVLGVDLGSATRRKIEKNRKKYPVELASGSMRKYTKLQENES